LPTRPGVASALAAGDTGTLRRIARLELRDPDIVLVAFFGGDGAELAAAGADDAIATSRLPVDFRGEPSGEILVAALEPTAFVTEIAELTGDDALIVSDGTQLAATTQIDDPGAVVDSGGTSLDLADEKRRAAGVSLAGAPSGTWLVLITDQADTFVASAPLVALVLVAFFALAMLLVLFALRVLRGQVASMLAAARRIGAGDFSGRVPVEGDDEIGGLAREFNKMSDRLRAQMGELRRQRGEIDESVRRIDKAFAAGLDRPATLEIVVETAVSACDAELGRIALAGKDGLEVIRNPAGNPHCMANSRSSSVPHRGPGICNPLRGRWESSTTLSESTSS